MTDIVVGIRLTADGKGLVGEVRLSEEALKKLRDAAREGSDGLDKYSQAQDKAADASKRSTSAAVEFFKGMLSYDVVKQATAALVSYAKEAATLSARHETLGVVMGVVGRNAGYTRGEMDAYAESIRKQGITMLQSREATVKLVQSNIDLAEGSKLARLAQDAAVIANTNSSEAMQRLIYGIQSAQPEMLRTMGINVNFEQSYAKLAKQLGVTTAQLTEKEKALARTNAVYEQGAAIAGTYEAAMGTAGKMMGSLARYAEDLKVIRGEIFNEALIIAVTAYTDSLKGANDEAKRLAANEEFKEWGRDIIRVLAFVADAVRGVIDVFRILGRSIAVGVEGVMGMVEVAGMTGGNPITTFRNREAIAARVRQSAAVGEAGLEDIRAILGKPTFQNTGADWLAARDAERRAVQTVGDVDDADQGALGRRLASGLTGDTRPGGKTGRGGGAQGADMADYVRELHQQLEITKQTSVEEKVLFELQEKRWKNATPALRAQAVEYAKQLDVRKQAEALEASIAKYQEQADAQQEKANDALRRWVAYSGDAVKSAEFEATLIGKTRDEAEKMVALQRLKVEYEKAWALAQGLSAQQLTKNHEAQRDALATQLDKNAAAREEVKQRDQGAQETKRAREREVQEAQRFNDEISRGLTGALMRGFEAGKDAGRNFRDTLVNMFKTMVLRPVIQWVLSPISGAISATLGGLGIPGLANASGGGAGGGIMNLLGLGNSAYSALSGGSSLTSGLTGALLGNAGAFGYAAAVPGLSAFGAGSQAALLAAQTGAFGSAGLAATASSASFAGGAAGVSAIGTAIPYIGLALAAAGALGLFGGKGKTPAVGTGYQHFGSFNPSTGLDWTTIGLTNKGSEAPVSRPNDPLLRTPLDAALKEFRSLARALGLDPSSLGSASFSVQTQGVGQAVTDAAIPGMVRQIASQWAEELMPNLRDMAQANEELIDTFTRLAAARRQVDLDRAFGMMGAALGLSDRTRDLWLSDLSPLTNAQRLSEAGSAYTITRMQAATGDVGAMTRLADVARGYLSEAREYYASSPDYTRIFSDVQSQIGGLVSSTLSQQSLHLVQMGVSLADIQANTQGLDARIASAMGVAEQATRLGALGLSMDHVADIMDAEMQTIVSHGLRFETMVEQLGRLDARALDQALQLTATGGSLESILALMNVEGGTLAEQSVRLAAMGLSLEDIEGALGLSSLTETQQLERLTGAALSLGSMSVALDRQVDLLSGQDSHFANLIAEVRRQGDEQRQHGTLLRELRAAVEAHQRATVEAEQTAADQVTESVTDAIETLPLLVGPGSWDDERVGPGRRSDGAE